MSEAVTRRYSSRASGIFLPLLSDSVSELPLNFNAHAFMHPFFAMDARRVSNL